MGKGKRDQSRSYMLFTGAMIACCIGLYLAQSPWAAPVRAEPEPTAALLYHSYPAEDAFLENAVAFGLDAQSEPLEGQLLGAAEYRLARAGMADAYLTLSFKEGGVCAFLLRLPRPEDPGELPREATPIEEDLYQARLCAFSAGQAWREGALKGLCAALDPAASCTAPDLSRFYALMEETVLKGTAREEKAGDLSFSSYILHQAGDEFLCASAARRDG